MKWNFYIAASFYTQTNIFITGDKQHMTVEGLSSPYVCNFRLILGNPLDPYWPFIMTWTRDIWSRQGYRQFWNVFKLPYAKL